MADRQTDKTSRWQMTVQEAQYGLLEKMPPGIAEWGWQDEICPTTGRKHKQGFLRTSSQCRLSALIKLLPGIHFEAARNWPALITYCGKKETRDPNGEQVRQTSTIPTKYSYATEVAEKLVRLYPGHKLWELEELLDHVKEQGLADICSGREGIEWIIIDPNWKLVWKETGFAMLVRANGKLNSQSLV